MDQQYHSKFGQWIFMLMAFCYLMTSVFAILFDLRIGKEIYMYSLSLIFVIAGCLLGLAAIPTISRLIGGEDDLLVKWMSNLAYLGFAILAIDFIRILQFRFGYHYWTQGKTPLALDPMGIFGFWGIGCWMIVVSVLGLRRGKMSKWLAGNGILFGLLHLPLTITEALHQSKVEAILMAGTMVLGPIWYFRLGLKMKKKAST